MAFVAPLTVLILILPTVLKLDEIESVAAENELPEFPGVIVNVGELPINDLFLGVDECVNLKSALNVCPTPGFE